MAEFCFSKSSRLLNAADYTAVFASTKLKVSRRFFLLLAKPNERACERLGIVIAKKNIPKAVNRNRIKRQIRESFRKNRKRLGSVDVVVLARADADKLSNSQIICDLNTLWQDLEKNTVPQAIKRD